MGFLLGLALRAVNLVLLVYCVLSFISPDSGLFATLNRYVQPVLDPVRRKLWQWFPKLRTLPVDLSPVALWLGLSILMKLVQGILL